MRLESEFECQKRRETEGPGQRDQKADYEAKRKRLKEIQR